MRITASRTLLTAALGLSLAAPALAAPLGHAAQKPGTLRADALHAHLIHRIDAIGARLTAEHKRRHVTATQAERMRKQLGHIRAESAGDAKRQGFLSAGESASYNRMLDALEAKLH